MSITIYIYIRGMIRREETRNEKEEKEEGDLKNTIFQNWRETYVNGVILTPKKSYPPLHTSKSYPNTQIPEIFDASVCAIFLDENPHRTFQEGCERSNLPPPYPYSLLTVDPYYDIRKTPLGFLHTIGKTQHHNNIIHCIYIYNISYNTVERGENNK